MRLLLVAILGLASPAFAGRTGGGVHTGGGGGRLAQVSSGLATATASAGTPSGTTGSGSYTTVGRAAECDRYRAAREHDPLYRATILERDCRGYWADPDGAGSVHRDGSSGSDPGASVTGFAGAQKVVGSDGSLSLALAVVDRRLRLNGSFTQYYETEMTGARVTMMAPELSAGVHLGPEGPTRVWLETGVMYLKTGDPAGSSSTAGPTVGARLEHRVSGDLSLAGAVEGAYLQDGVHGVAGRVGVQFHHVEAAFRVLALNVGPALYGPEVGVGF